MKKNNKKWLLASKNISKINPSESDKNLIKEYFQPLIDSFKKKYILTHPNKDSNYLIDIYSKWYQGYFYLIEKYKSEHPNRIADEFEIKFVRLKFVGNNLFDFSYLRHTNQWFLIAENKTKEECLEMIKSNSAFHPI